MTDEELLEEKRKQKKTKIIYALLIGFLIGIVVWSVANNTWGLFTLIPLYFIYRLVNNSNNNKD